MHWLHGRFKLTNRHDKIDSWLNGKHKANPIGRGISKNKDSSNIKNNFQKIIINV